MRVLCALIQLQDFTLTAVTMNLIKWQRYFATLPHLKVDIERFNQYPFERNFNEIVRYAIDNDYDYLFQYDADMIGNRTIIEKLISHNKECVGCLFFSRLSPHKPQLWNTHKLPSGKISFFDELTAPSIKNAVLNRALVKTDTRAGGFTLFKVSALKEFTYPYAEFKANASRPYEVNGIDIDLTYKITQKFGGVYTDCDRGLEVEHIALQGVSYESTRI